MNIKNLTAPISRTTGNLATKTHGEAFHIRASNWEKNGGFNITFKWFSTLVVCMYFVWKTPKSRVFLQGTVSQKIHFFFIWILPCPIFDSNYKHFFLQNKQPQTTKYLCIIFSFNCFVESCLFKNSRYVSRH